MTHTLLDTMASLLLSIMSFFVASIIVVSFVKGERDIFEHLWLWTIAIPLGLFGVCFALGAIGASDITRIILSG